MNDLSGKGDQARQEILLAAQRLFLRNGYHGTSMRAIAREAGDRAVAGIYNHFPTKEAIFAALIEEHSPYEDLFDALELSLEGVATAPEFVRRALGTVMQIMPQHYDYLELVQIDVREFEGETLRKMLEAHVFPRISGLIMRVTDLPGMKPINPIVLMRLMASILIGFIFTDQMAQRTIFKVIPREDWVDYYANALLFGIADPAFRPDEGEK